MEINPVVCKDCQNHVWLWYCTKGNDVSVFGETECMDQVRLNGKAVLLPKLTC